MIYSIFYLVNPLEDVDSLGYKYPKLVSNESSLTHFILKNCTYFTDVQEAEIQGTVVLKFFIDTFGNIANPVIKKGVHILLDKEVIRVLKLAQFSHGP